MKAETKELIINALDPREPRRASEVAQRSGLSETHVLRALVALEGEGCVVETTGFTRNRAWTRKRTKGEAASEAYRKRAESAAQQHAERAEDALEAIALRAFARLDPETRQRFLERAIDEL